MCGRSHSVLFAALLLVVQLPLGVLSGGAMAHDDAQHCGDCPDGSPSSPMQGTDSHGDVAAGHQGDSGCGFDCSPDGSTDTGHAGCGFDCAMLSSGHCGSPVSPTLAAMALLATTSLADAFGRDRSSVMLPDSPLFDFLRPPTRS